MIDAAGCAPGPQERNIHMTLSKAASRVTATAIVQISGRVENSFYLQFSQAKCQKVYGEKKLTVST